MSELVGNALIVVSAGIALVFVSIYHFSAYWWRHADGRHVFTFMSVIAAVLLLATLRVVFGTSEWFNWVRVAVFAGVPFVLGWRLWILITAQWQRKIQDKRRADHDDRQGSDPLG